MKNLLLRLRLYWLVYIKNYFSNDYAIIYTDSTGYSTTFFDNFRNGVDWNFWQPNEIWGNVKDANNPYIIWKAEQVTQESNRSIFPAIKLTTDLNNVQGEPQVKSGQICSWKSLYQAYGKFRCSMKAAPSGFQNWRYCRLHNYWYLWMYK